MGKRNQGNDGRILEQDLVDMFVAQLRTHTDANLCIENLHNSGCGAHAYADVEFTAKSGALWAIEAKTHESQDKHNTAHKLFGELLKETGRGRDMQPHFAVLIPMTAIDFYSEKFQAIDRRKFVDFGKLIPVRTVFACDRVAFTQLTWEELYDAA